MFNTSKNKRYLASKMIHGTITTVNIVLEVLMKILDDKKINRQKFSAGKFVSAANICGKVTTVTEN